MTEFNQYNNVALMAAIQEFYEERARANAEVATASTPSARVVAAEGSRLTHAFAAVRRFATTPLPVLWRRTAA